MLLVVVVLELELLQVPELPRPEVLAPCGSSAGKNRKKELFSH